MIPAALAVLITAAPFQDSAPAERLAAAAAELSTWPAISWEIRNEESEEPAPTRVVATRSPLRFRAVRAAQDGAASAVLGDEERVRALRPDGSVTGERPTFPTGQRDVVSVLNAAGADFAATWQVLLDADYLRQAARSGQLLDAGRDDVAGEACRVLLFNRSGRHEVYGHFHIAHYIWLSEADGLPRATQQLRRMRGRARLGPRFRIDRLRRIDPGVADFSIESVAEAMASRGVPTSSSPALDLVQWTGMQAPDPRLHDREGRDVRLSDLRGKPLVVTFWATWCAPCLKELPHLDAIQTDHGDRLQIVAIATRDARLDVLAWLEENDAHTIDFWLDADLRGEATAMTKAFGLDGPIPDSLLIDAQGKIVARWRGYRDATFWRERVTELLEEH